MSFGDYNFTEKTAEEVAKDMSLSNLKYELTKSQDTDHETLILLKESNRRILEMLESQESRCNCHRATYRRSEDW